MSFSLGDALGRGAGIAVRALAVPPVLGLRWLGQARAGDESRRAATSPALALKAALDEIFFTTEILGGSFVSPGQLERTQEEVEAAAVLFRRRGWLDDPVSYHVTPRRIPQVRMRKARQLGVSYQHLSFESEYAPHAGEPGRDRWLGYTPNATAHAWVLEHRGAPRPWVVCIPGYRMGHPAVDFTGFRVRRLYEGLGLNVAIPVHPFHGPRKVGRRGGDGYLSGDFLDTVHAISQAVWDARRLLRWLRRDRRAPGVGLYGVSLGSYTAGLLAALEPDLDCVVCGIPASDFLDLARWNAPAGLFGAARWAGYPWDRIRDVLRVVSPLHVEVRVPRRCLFLYAGVADRLAPPSQAKRLWQHWGRPRIEWYAGSHVSFLFEPAVRRLLHEAFAATGLIERKPLRRRRGQRPRPRVSRSARSGRRLPATPRP